ncbi:MAG: hypothetical protein IJV06_05605 [Bacteroidaceae bacterium]|nr:hypothetical protein [Bacteroidaceae bacterium]
MQRINKKGTMSEVTTTRRRKKRKLTIEERRALYASLPAGNKYMEAARRHQGEIWVKDPMLLL